MPGLRNYETPSRETVDEFYQLNHRYQTLAFAQAKKRQFGALRNRRMGVWDACLHLNELVDDSDPDTELSQIQHLVQSAEAARRDGRPDWFVLACLVHDLGKILCLRGEPQWAVVGDTFPLGCPFDPAVVYHDYFADNPDAAVDEYQTGSGIYAAHCGFANVTMSWGHDEYMYLVARNFLPDKALYLIRFHSFYAAHHQGAYDYLTSDVDREMMPLLKEFSAYDLYSKADDPPDVDALAPYYQNLIDTWFPAEIDW